MPDKPMNSKSKGGAPIVKIGDTNVAEMGRDSQVRHIRKPVTERPVK